MNRKRKLELAEKESLEMFLTQLGSEEAVGTSGGLVDLDVGLKRKGSDEKEAKLDTARNKACRERARRERLNDSFAELSKALDPRKDVKTDKTSIVADAIRVVTQLRAENGQLKQLNKFLEERVGSVEKQKADAMLQQAYFQQQAGGAGPSLIPQMPQQQQQSHMQPVYGVAPGVPVGHFNAPQAAVMQYMGMPPQSNMGLPQQQSSIAQGMAAGMLPQGMQPQPMQSMQPQGMQPQGLQHGDMMMQQHTHVQDHMNNALSLDAFSHDLLDDAFPSFPSPAVETQSSSSQQQADSGGSTGKRVKSETRSQAVSSGSAPLTKNTSLQRNLRKLTVRGRAKPNGQQPPQSSPDDLFTAAMQSAQMQMSMAMPVVGPGSWLSPSTLDTSQDGVRRPPAA
ncbi:hypothetical protein WJX77_007466 [Trebouxia sp. C0004]